MYQIIVSHAFGSHLKKHDLFFVYSNHIFDNLVNIVFVDDNTVSLHGNQYNTVFDHNNIVFVYMTIWQFGPKLITNCFPYYALYKKFTYFSQIFPPTLNLAFHGVKWRTPDAAVFMHLK